jgi:hypothetical protein
MWSRTCRPFTLVDALFLIAGTSVGLASARFYCAEEFGTYFITPLPLNRGNSLFHNPVLLRDTLAGLGVMFGIMLMCWNATFFALRFQRRTKPMRFLLRLPGTIICMNGLMLQMIMIVTKELNAATGWGIPSHLTHFCDLNSLLEDMPLIVGFGSASVWFTLYMCGRARLEAGWLDRMGVSIGLLWSALLVYQTMAVPVLMWLIQSW